MGKREMGKYHTARHGIMTHSKIKHLSLQLFWLRDAVQGGLTSPSFVTMQEMAAVIFTKALDQFKVQKCATMLSLFDYELAALHRHGGVLFVARFHSIAYLCICTTLQVSYLIWIA